MTEQLRMTKTERTELNQLIRKRERVMKAAASERAAQLLADFDAQLATIYSFDDDEVWETATREVAAVVEEAQKAISARCEELGIPKQFAPHIQFNWYGRGENEVAVRRAELRRAAKSEIQAMEAEAKTKIERLSLEAQTAVIANGLETDTAKEFLTKVSTVDEFMPQLEVLEVKSLVDARDKKRDVYL